MELVSMRSLLPLLLCCSQLGACKPRTEAATETRSLVLAQASNGAVLFGAPGRGESFLKGVKTDLDLFGASLKQYYPILRQESGYEISKQDMLSKIAASAADVTDDYGTLLIYFTGHGTSDNGDWVAQDRERVSQKEVMAAVRSRRNAPLGRLILISDSCFSGNWVNGANAPSRSTPSVSAALDDHAAAASLAQTEAALSRDFALGESFEARRSTVGYGLTGNAEFPLFRELVVFAASGKNETAKDSGEKNGGHFTWSFRHFLDQLPLGTTIQEFAGKVISSTKRDADRTPVYRVFPVSLQKEDMFGNYYGLPNQAATDHAQALTSEISRLIDCDVGVARMTTGTNIKNGRYRFEMVNRLSGNVWATWSNVNTPVEEEAKGFLGSNINSDSNGSGFFAGCSFR